MSTRRYTIHPPQLVDRPWKEASQELQRFLRYLTNSNDQTQANVKNIDISIETIEEVKSDRFEQAYPRPHTHIAEYILGLEPPYRRRPPSAHTHLNADLPNSLATDGSRQFDQNPPTPTRPRSLFWDDTDKTLAVTLNDDVTLQIGQEEHVLALNNNLGYILENGRVAKCTGVQGNRVTADYASWASESDIHHTLGVITEDIENNTQGYITTFGIIRGLNTNAFNEGDILYLGGTQGQLTNVLPTKPTHVMCIGIVLKKGGAGIGSIFVKPVAYHDIDELNDVSVVSPADGQLLQYDVSTQTWKNVSMMSAVGILPVKPHTHLVSDVLGAGTGSGSGGDPLESFRARPHTHTEADLMNVVTVDNTGSPGTGLTLGDFILASQIFGG